MFAMSAIALHSLPLLMMSSRKLVLLLDQLVHAEKRIGCQCAPQGLKC